LEDYQTYLNSKSSSKKGEKFVQQIQENEKEFSGNNYKQDIYTNNLPQIHVPAEETPDNNYDYKNVDSYQQNQQYNKVDPYLNQQYDHNINGNSNNYNNNANDNINLANQPSKNNYNNNMSDYQHSERTRKFEQQQTYKNYLDAQVSTRTTRSQSSARAYENRVMLPKKNVEPKINPFSNKNYEFGLSALGHNPILNPTNNYGYNKYISSGTPSNKFQMVANNIIG